MFKKYRKHRKKTTKNAISGYNNYMEKKNQKTEKKGKSLAAKIILRIVTVILIFALGCGTFYFVSKKFSSFFSVEKESKSALVERQLSYCQELVTAKYRYSDIITLKKSSGFAKSYSIVKYSGIVRVGIADFTDVSYYLSTNEKTVTVRLPKMEVLGNEIVSQEVFDEKQSIFVPISTQEIFDEIESARAEALEDMIAQGILKESAEYAKKIITQFMYACGFEEVILI